MRAYLQDYYVQEQNVLFNNLINNIRRCDDATQFVGGLQVTYLALHAC